MLQVYKWWIFILSGHRIVPARARIVSCPCYSPGWWQTSGGGCWDPAEGSAHSRLHSRPTARLAGWEKAAQSGRPAKRTGLLIFYYCLLAKDIGTSFTSIYGWKLPLKVNSRPLPQWCGLHGCSRNKNHYLNRLFSKLIVSSDQDTMLLTITNKFGNWPGVSPIALRIKSLVVHPLDLGTNNLLAVLLHLLLVICHSLKKIPNFSISGYPSTWRSWPPPRPRLQFNTDHHPPVPPAPAPHRPVLRHSDQRTPGPSQGRPEEPCRS